jgi:hypothetical protein
MTGMYPRRQGLLARAVKPMLVLVIILGIFALVRLRAAVVSLQYDIGEIEKQKSELMVQRKALQAQFSSMLSMKNIEGRELALVFPDRKRVIYVKREEGGMPYAASMGRK